MKITAWTTRLTFVALVLPLLPTACQKADESARTGPAQQSMDVVWSLEEGVETPECVYFDAISESLFLSQIGGGGSDGKDGDGWISKLSLEGQVVVAKWVQELNAPKGMSSYEGTLWVSDIDRLVAIDIEEGKIVQIVAVPGATFLNDVACGSDGTVYVSDTSESRIHRYANGELSVLANGPQLQHPNGLLFQGDRLVIGAWGVGMHDDWSTDKAGQLLALDLKSGDVTALSPAELGHLDGVTDDGGNGYLVTDWMAGKVMHIGSDQTVTTLWTFRQGTADLTYLADRQLLILPQMLENKIIAIRWKADIGR